ncbi:MAG: hypothetical protein F6K00_02320 [Leptolyngbya sp. SIOISBB]|nr:hypothetical protein [Leptolyngbya sp. SIOISBB]
MGRFLSEDPMGFAAGDANLYRYVFNSPTNYTDPGGMRAVPVKIGPKPSVKPRGGASSTTSGRTPTGYPVHSPELPNGPSLWPSTEELVRPLLPTLSPVEQVERWRKQAGIPEPSFGDPLANLEIEPAFCPIDYEHRYRDDDDDDDIVSLWRAPRAGRSQKELIQGFSPEDFPEGVINDEYFDGSAYLARER